MKRLFLSFLKGLVLWIVLVAVWMSGLAVWNSTINTADRTWIFAGKEYSSAEMRAIVLELKDEEGRGIESACYNPKNHVKGYSGALLDRSRGSSVNMNVLNPENTDSYSADLWDRFADKLACYAVLPDDGFPEYVRVTVTNPIYFFFLGPLVGDAFLN